MQKLVINTGGCLILAKTVGVGVYLSPPVCSISMKVIFNNFNGYIQISNVASLHATVM